MRTSTRPTAILAATLAALVFTGVGCFSAPAPTIRPVTLTYWSTDLDAAAFAEVVAEHKKLYPHVDIALTTFRREDYARALVEALAEDRGPDLFSLPNTQLRSWQARILPLPERITLPVRVVDEQQRIVTVNRDLALPNRVGVTRDFVETVPRDVYLTQDRLYGLPLSLDTPALFANTALLRAADIAEPAATWHELQQQVARLTLRNADGSIRQSGIALGLAANVLHSTDILATLMLQNGAQLMDDTSRRATFHMRTPATERSAYAPGTEALIFYQNFADPFSASYSWNATQPSSLDAFVTGTTAFFVGFPRDVATIRERAPGLQFTVSPLPLIDASRRVTVAHYPVEVVSAKSANPSEAWGFLLFLTAPEQASTYLATTKRPTALRALIAAQLADAEILPFAGQVLTARSWYRGVADYARIEEIFARAILRKPTAQQPHHDQILVDAAGEVDRAR